MIVDAFWELSGWDGRFASTVRALVRHPGMLTREFLEGRRARFLSPLRLYLMASLAYFVVAAAAPDPPTTTKKGPLGLTVTAPTTAPAGSRPERVANAVTKSLDVNDPDPDLSGRQEMTPEQKARALKDIEHAPAIMRPFARRAIEDPKGLKRGIAEMMPRMLFVLLPIFAATVAIFYRGRKYPEHLYFAIHLHAFAFLALTIIDLVKFTRVSMLVAFAGMVAVIWVPVYATLAFRRAYGGALGRTIAKEVGIGTIYALASLVAFLLTIYWVALFA